MITILSTLFCALSRGSDDTGTNGGGAVVIKYLTFWRILLAFGLGRDYPISATVPSDKAVLTYRRRGRGQLIAILTSIQGLGNLMASTMTLMVLVRFSVLIVADEAESDAESMDLVWRICIAVGCLPALSTSLVRFTMPPTILMSTSRMSMYSQSYDDIDEIQLSNNCKDQLSCSKTNDNILPHLTAHTASPPLPPKTYQRRRQSTVFREYCSQWENLKVLIGTSLPWFLLDLEFRSISLNQSYLLDFMGMIDDHNNNSNTTAALNSTSPNNNSTTLYRHLRMTSLGNLTVSLLGIAPGYWFVIFSIEKMGCTRAQFLCFAVLLLFCTLLSTAFHQLKVLVPLFITTFTLSQFFSNLRRSTPFVVPGEVFPTRVRATAQGVSAGTGKIGAVLVTLMFNRLVEIDSRSRTLRGGSLSGTTTTTMVGIGVVLSVMIVGFLAMTFVFPRGARRLSSKA
ncbi:hypothetical protein BGX23_008555 [Mortierella sp. AD031]|nr:hypothetical protein BGX23_008555 [Mortierella sp. AD031]